ncbi:hypothetical protein LSCM1_03497 [Leishmania martiniquensis]|uniref:Uncharacterized protein n=1 Tax=Leishmania martiniquensis TaxID=1580590 RepID=A0A836KGM4_9TRYP|nr:hypothetical protein LSCM1_03497 [Leishmania martiniquensis]
MSDANWALEENGARIAEVSHEAVHIASTASNLLQPREDQLWITGDAPQHVTVSLSPSHPPLQYAGWHVWHDYLTNPRMVEIASGASPGTVSTLLVCQALPGAGTQVWRLPKAIPQDHLYVRFRIMDTFGAGPTYMNNIVLLEHDPGPNYNVHRQQIEAAATATEDFPYRDSVAQHPSAAAASPYMSPLACAFRPTVAAGGADCSPLPRRVPPASVLPGAVPTPTATPRGRCSADVGVYIGSGPSASVHRGDGTLSPGGARSSRRMSQLLRDLDEDIKMLKPIKIVSPGKNMLLSAPQDSPARLLGSECEDDASAARTDGGSHEVHANGKGGHRGETDSTEGRHHRRHHCRSSSSRRRSRADRAGRSRNRRSAQSSSSQPPQPASISGTPMTLAVWPPPGAPSPAAELSALHDARLSALEQTVAGLNEAVQRQCDDLAMIRRVLLQQAMERRKEAEQRSEEMRKMGAVASAPPTPPAPPPVAPPPTVTAVAEAPASQIAALDQRLTHRNISVGFPEGALRAYVESVLEHKLHKHMKKVEERLLKRLDNQLHDVIKVLSATIEGRLGGLAPSTAAAQRRTASLHRSFYTERVTPTQAGGLPTASFSTAREMTRGSADLGGPRIDISDVGSCPSSLKGNYYHMPLTRHDTSGRAPATGAAAAATAALPASYTTLRSSPHAYPVATEAPPVSFARRSLF